MRVLGGVFDFLKSKLRRKVERLDDYKEDIALELSKRVKEVPYPLAKEVVKVIIKDIQSRVL